MLPSPLFPDPTSPAIPQRVIPYPVGPVEALASLRTGNVRFAQGSARPGRNTAGDLRPYAVVVGCLDARVPVETVFDQSAGAICVVRSAGHVLDRAMFASVEFAVTELKVPLVLVLGHEDCRAVAATVEAVRTGRRPAGARGFLVDEIAPAVLDTGPADANLDRVTRAHVRRTVARLSQADRLAEQLAARRVDIVGAVYRLDTGHVEVL
ncbi:carbonic anhydrase [Actinomycetes bacterium KLBMP 9797]